MDVSYRTTLELDKIIARAVQLCTCAETKEMMRAIEPFATTEEERYALAQTNAINALLLKNGSPRFGAVHEVRRVVAHAAKGGILSMGELLEIAAALRNFSGLAQWYGLTDHDMLPTDDLFFALAPQPVLEKQIGECIISPEEMADTASVTLRDLRRKIRATEDSIRTKLDAIIKNSTTNKFLQDAVVSIRNGRYVVPVVPSTAVKSAASSTMFPPLAPPCLWSPPLWWKPTPALCSCTPKSRRKSPAF